VVHAESRGVAPRSARALVCGAVTVSLAAAAHVAGGGAVVTTAGLVALTAMTSIASYAVLGSRASRTRILALVVTAQIVLHTMLELGSTVSGHTALLDHGVHGAETMAAGGAGGLVLAHLATDVTSASGLAMTAAHLVAAVLVGLWLSAGEGLLGSLAALAGSAFAARVLRALATLAARPAVAADSWSSYLTALSRQRGGRWHQLSWVPVATVARRGPPLGAYAESN